MAFLSRAAAMPLRVPISPDRPLHLDSRVILKQRNMQTECDTTCSVFRARCTRIAHVSWRGFHIGLLHIVSGLTYSARDVRVHEIDARKD